MKERSLIVSKQSENEVTNKLLDLTTNYLIKDTNLNIKFLNNKIERYSHLIKCLQDKKKYLISKN